MALFGCREFINIGGGFVVAIARCRKHVARLEYGYGTHFTSKGKPKILVVKHSTPSISIVKDDILPITGVACSKN